MLKLAILSAVLAVVLSQAIVRDGRTPYVPPQVYRQSTNYNPPRRYEDRPYYADEAPKPYAFSYDAPSDQGPGSSSRTEAGDASGRVQGSYSLTNEEGHTRVVEYVADENGFRATVRTNEPGTANQSPADVHMESAAIHPYASNIDRTPYRSGIIRSGRARHIINPVEEVEQPIHTEPHVVAQPAPAYSRRIPHHAAHGGVY